MCAVNARTWCPDGVTVTPNGDGTRPSSTNPCASPPRAVEKRLMQWRSAATRPVGVSVSAPAAPAARVSAPRASQAPLEPGSWPSAPGAAASRPRTPAASAGAGRLTAFELSRRPG